VIVRALACDYDGTLASQDRIDPAALAALDRAREGGLRLVLVTGRTFFELTRVCDRLDLFDAVVAENGAVLYFPPSGVLRDQAPAPSPRLLAELDRRGVSYRVGRIVVDAARGDEPRVREALEAAAVELELVYNRGALMLLPPGVSKGTGVRQVLRDLGLSFHDVLGFGDAENDVPLFDVCGFTACPDNAIAAVRSRADWVLGGDDGGAIAEAITGGVLGGGLVPARVPRHRIQVGWAAESSEPVTIPARGVNVLIQGDPLSGKSWLAGAFVERLVARRYAVSVIDPEGDYPVLARLPGVNGVAVQSVGALDAALVEVERDPAACLVADLSALPHARKLRVVERGLERIRDLRRRLGRPHWVVLDEAHYSLHPNGVGDASLGIDAKGFCLSTYRTSWIRGPVLDAVDVFLLARTTVGDELAFLRSALGRVTTDAERVVAVLPELPPGRFVLVQRGDGPEPGAVTLVPVPRETVHVRHLTKYSEGTVQADQRFFFRYPDGRLAATADSLSSFRQAVAAVDAGILAYHAGRGDFSRWVIGVFSDPLLGQQLRKIEGRWRRGEVTDLRAALERLVALRYGPP
jgi:hydroxymethylpyrimidine pyrophosphatase-like HAD family hydrolase